MTPQELSVLVVEKVRAAYGASSNEWRRIDWDHVGQAMKTGQLQVDPDGVLRFRGDPFTRARFEGATRS